MLKTFDRKERFFLLGLLILAFMLRLGFTLLLKQHYLFYDSPSSDVTYYQEWARKIATGHVIGDQTFFGLPLYPYVLALLFRISLGHLEIMRLFHLILGSLNCLFIYLIAKKIFNRRTAGLTAILMASNFLMIYYDWLMMPVTLIITLTLLITLALIDRNDLTQPRYWIILGFLIGLTILGDGKFLFFLLAASVWLLWENPKKTHLILCMCLGATAVLGACALRNKIVGGDWVMISAQSGLSLYAGNNPEATGTYLSPDFIRPTHAAQDEDQRIVAEAIAKKSLTPGQISSLWKKKALDFITQHPGDYARLLVKKFFLFFRNTEYADDLDLLFMRDWKNRWDYNHLIILFPLAIIGMAISFKHWKTHPFPILLIACQILVTLIFFLSTRHRATILPFLLMFQAAAILWILTAIKEKQVKRLLSPFLLTLIFLFLARPIKMEQQLLDANRYAKAGAVYLKKGFFDLAKTHFYQALKIHPNDTTTFYNLGNIAVAENDLAKAEQLYLSALDLCSFNVDALFNLGYVYEQQGKWDKALNTYQKVLTYQPDIPDVYFRIAHLYAKQGQCQTAALFYQKVIAINPELKSAIQEYIIRCR